MHKLTPHKELYDPFYHYTRGVLYFDEERYTFTAYRMPYKELDDKSWRRAELSEWSVRVSWTPTLLLDG